MTRARACAEKLELEFECRFTGLRGFADALGIEEGAVVPDPEAAWSA
jgi:hypothetical protein